MSNFVEERSIVRKIWGKGDTILFIFAGAAAEFALNKAVDWLYFTGRLPKDPIGRLFSTVTYARMIVFADKATATQAITSIAQIHAHVETKRGSKIPDWAYRDVLFMLIHYSIAAYEILERKLLLEEKVEVFRVFNKVGNGMQLKGLPKTFAEYQRMRQSHLKTNLYYSKFTEDLYRQFKQHLGILRYWILIEVQKILVPKEVFKLLVFKRKSVINPLIRFYKLSRKMKLDGFFKAVLLPQEYKQQIKTLDALENSRTYRILT